MRSLAVWACCILAAAAPLRLRASLETIVCLRHGERTRTELGQLSIKGLNRALALPPVLIARFGPPQYLFAPDPARNRMSDGKKGSPLYDYVRPLATIEPLAIQLGLPVNTQFGFKEIGELETEVLKPQYHSAVIFVTWEHAWEAKFAAKLVADLGGAPGQVPPWATADFDSLYVIRIERTGDKTTVSFQLDHEGLQGMSDQFPAPAPPAPPRTP